MFRWLSEAPEPVEKERYLRFSNDDYFNSKAAQGSVLGEVELDPMRLKALENHFKSNILLQCDFLTKEFQRRTRIDFFKVWERCVFRYLQGLREI